MIFAMVFSNGVVRVGMETRMKKYQPQVYTEKAKQHSIFQRKSSIKTAQNIITTS